MSGVVFMETLRRHLQNVAYVAILIVLSALALLFGWFGGPSGFWMGFASLAGIILGCQLIGPEFSSGTLQLVLAKPVNRSAYLLSRYAGVLVAIAIYFAVPTIFDVVARLVLGKAEFAGAMLITPLNTAVTYVIVVALLAFFGTFTRSYLNVALYFLTQLVLYAIAGAVRSIEAGSYAISPFFKSHSQIREGILAVIKNLFPSAPPELDWRWMLMVVSNAAVALVLACLIFSRREVPYGAD